jgi:hypothetical protein
LGSRGVGGSVSASVSGFRHGRSAHTHTHTHTLSVTLESDDWKSL